MFLKQPQLLQKYSFTILTISRSPLAVSIALCSLRMFFLKLDLEVYDQGTKLTLSFICLLQFTHDHKTCIS
jgi:hypothetical protein